MKKGFTLIELLAVIVILAIISLITIPQLAKVIDSARIDALKASVNGLNEAARIYNVQHNNDSTVRFDIKNNDITSKSGGKLNYKGSIKQGVVIINPKGKTAICVTDLKNSAYRSFDDDEVKIVLNKVCSIDDSYDLVLNGLEKADYTFNNVELMKKGNVNEGNTIYTRGFYSKGDGGAAYYEVIKDNSKTGDNSYILLDNGLMAKLVIKDKTVNVKMLGAKGDGVTDDTKALKNAFKRAKEGDIYFPKGTYMISDQLWFSNASIIGEGKESIIKAMDNYKIGNAMLYVNEANKFSIKNITLSGNIEENTREEGFDDIDGIHMLDIWGSSNVFIDKVNFIDNVYVAIRIIKDSSNIKVTNSTFTNVDCGVSTIGSGSIDHMIVENNTFDGHYNSESVSFFGTGTYTNITVNNNTIKNKTYGHAIVFGASGGKTNGAKIINNTINDCSVGIRVEHANDVDILNNKINMENTISLKKGGIGILIKDASNINVIKNTVEKTVQAGMLIQGCSTCDINSNTIKDSGNLNNDWYFADIRGVNSDLVFSKNKLIRTDSSLFSYLMNVHGDGGVVIKDNIFENGKLLLYSDSSNMVCSNNNVEVLDKGTNNKVD